MKLKRLLSSLLVSLLLLSQAPWAVLAEDISPAEATPTTTTVEPAPPTTTPTTTPVAEPAPSTTASTTGATEPVSTATIEPSTTNSPTAATTTPEAAVTSTSQTTGPQLPTGTIPEYAFNDAARRWEPTVRDSFSWDAASGLWVSPFYWYEPVVGWYHVKKSAVLANPDYVAAGAATLSDMSDPLAALEALFSDPLNANTGPNSNNYAGLNNTNSALLNLSTLARITNNLTSTATSGGATVGSNTFGGNATSGPATVVANLLNFINSLWSWSNGGLSYFVNNLFGNQKGDITLQPTVTTTGGGGLFGCAACAGGLLTANQNTGPNSSNHAVTNENTDLTVNYRPSGVINNNLDLLAMSGNASVDSNTNGGNASSGDATVQLNIMNLINSAIAAGQSFFGMLNIFGNLNGDILFPDGFLDGVAPSSAATSAPVCSVGNDTTGTNSDNNATCVQSNNTNVNNSPSATFINDINMAARSGTATVESNTNAGNATSGPASTNSNTYNLFNGGVFGDNAVLVLVNVMGRWVGRIMNLPTFGESSAALLTGNATVQNLNTGPETRNDASYSGTANLDINNSPSGVINNNIRAGAISGDASVTNNTVAGSATSGAAKVASNVANFFGSTLNLKKWFGVLIINVFGDWTGSVNEDTSAGNEGQPVAALSSQSQAPAGESINQARQVGGSSSGTTSGIVDDASTVQDQSMSSSGARSAKVAGAQGLSKSTKAKGDTSATTAFFLLAALCLAGTGALIGLEKKLSRRT
jgi:hypothetical protein